MINNRQFCGILPAIASPCDKNGVFQEDDFTVLAKSLYQADINGLYVCGGTGDGWKMSVDERKRAAEIAVKVSKEYNGTVIIHVGCMIKSDDSLQLATHASMIGADAISSIPPKELDQQELVDYYKSLAEATDIPVLVYHIPMLTGNHPRLEEILELLDIPGVIGLKMTDWNLFLMQRLRLARPESIIFSGFDEILCPGLLYGANGGIGTWYNLFPKVYVNIYKAVQAGNIKKAMILQHKLTSFCDWAWKVDIETVFELLMRERGLAEHCFRDFKSPVDIHTLEKAKPELDKQVAILNAIS